MARISMGAESQSTSHRIALVVLDPLAVVGVLDRPEKGEGSPQVEATAAAVAVTVAAVADRNGVRAMVAAAVMGTAVAGGNAAANVVGVRATITTTTESSIADNNTHRGRAAFVRCGPPFTCNAHHVTVSTRTNHDETTPWFVQRVGYAKLLK